MKLERFFEKFELFADAPNAVAKMRELLIHFAVSGKLVPNDPHEKPVALTLSSTSSDETELPLNWRSGLVGEIFAFEYGDNLPAPKRTQSGEYPVYGSNGIVGTHDTYLTKEPALIVGRKGSAGALNIADGPSWTTDVAYFVRPPENIDLRFTYYLFSTLRLDELGKGIKPGLSRKEAYALPIALPPLAEQKRIVAKLDELMALCNRLEAQQQDLETRRIALTRSSLARFADAPTSANLQFIFHPSYAIPPADLRKSILTLAVQGKLVPNDPCDEPAEELLKRILVEQARLVKAGQIRHIETAPFAEDEELFPIPSSWTWTRLGQIGDWGSGSTPPRGNDEFYGGRVPWLKSGELNDDQTLAGSVETVTELAIKSCSFRLNKSGDVLLAMYGATIGKAAILAEAAVTNQAVCGCTPFPGVLNTYLFHYILSQREAFHAASEGGAQPNISKIKIVGYPFPLPPLAEQRRIVTKVSQLMALVDDLEAQLAASRAIAANLLKAVVAELTTQA